MNQFAKPLFFHKFLSTFIERFKKCVGKVFQANLISASHICVDIAFIFDDSLLIVVLGTLQKDLHIASFIEPFKTVALEESY